MQKIPKIMKNATKLNRVLRYLLMLVIWLCFMNFVCICSGSSRTDGLPGHKETMYVSAFFVFREETALVTNVELNFDSITTGPTVDTSKLAFNDGFIEARCELIREARKFFISFDIYYDSQVGKANASAYADDVAQEFLKKFGYEGLNKFWNKTGSSNSIIEIKSNFGYMDYQPEQVSTFLKYKPVGGFGRFIDDLVNKYVVRNKAVIQLGASYTLKKNADLDFSWCFEIYGAENMILPWDVNEYSDVIDVNDLLNNNSTIIEQANDHSTIIILIEKNRNDTSRTYSIDVKDKDIQPKGYSIGDSKLIGWENFVEIKYESLKIENITINITVNSSTHNQDFPFELMIAIIILIILAVSLISLFFYHKKKRRRRWTQ